MDVRFDSGMDVAQSQGEPRLLVSRRALLHNLQLIRRRLSAGTKICAMVKAEAYGHGANLVVDTLCNYQLDGLSSPAVDMLGVGCLDEAAALNETSLPILVLRAVENVYIGQAREAIEQAIRSGWILTLGTGAAADDVARVAMSMGKLAKVHVMIDTGMTRCGCDYEHLPELLRRIEAHSSLKLSSVGTHLATADVPDHEFVARQLEKFRTATDSAGKVLRHIANSGGIFFRTDAQFDMVRPGISMYGIDPTCKPHVDRPLQPVAKWTASIVSILDAKAGATIGYGQTWTAPRDTRIGLVPVGYADGYLRSWGNRSVMLVQGKAVPVVGRVSMDLTTIDLHDVPSAQIGDEVTIMDNDPLSPCSAYALAELAGTIPYEVLTRIGSRVKRVGVEDNNSPQRR